MLLAAGARRAGGWRLLTSMSECIQFQADVIASLMLIRVLACALRDMCDRCLVDCVMINESHFLRSYCWLMPKRNSLGREALPLGPPCGGPPS